MLRFQFERQNLSPALKVFDEVGTLRILSISRPTMLSDTADFVYLIHNVWNIFNVNVLKNDIQLKDKLSKELEYNDSRFSFLSRVVDVL